MATAEQVLEKPALPEPARRKPKRQWVLPTYTGLVLAYLFFPVVVMAIFGFNDYSGRFNLVWEGFTLEHYLTLDEFPELISSLRTSLIIAGVSALIATSLGTMIALALTRYVFNGRSGLNLFVFIPMATPEVVLGISLLALFVVAQVTRGLATLLIAHTMFCISYVVVTVKARTSGLDGNLEDAAQDLGATPWVTFWTVTFPLIFPGIAAAALLSAVLSIDDYVISSFIAGDVLTFPLWIYGISRFGVPGQVNVVGTLLLLVGVIYVVVNLWRSREAKEAAPLPMGRG
jgi:spermidine/putrescine transport system permease protein